VGLVGFYCIRLRSVIRWALILGAAVAAGVILYRVLSGPGRWAAPSGLVPVAALPLDQPAPDFTLTDLSGQTVQLAALKGQPVLLMFWTTWCPGCREGLTALETVYRQFRQTHGVTVLAVNIMEPADPVRAFVREHGWTFPVLLDTDGEVSNAYRVRIAPSLMFIDANGVLRDRVLGEFGRDLVVARLQPLLPNPLPGVSSLAAAIPFLL